MSLIHGKGLLNSGAVVTNGTDNSVEDVDPIECFMFKCDS